LPLLNTMTRVKSIAAKRHRKVKKLAKGFKQARRTRVKTAKEALLHAGQYAYVGRKNKKRNFRKLWIIRLSIAAKEHGLSYSELIAHLAKKQIAINRKVLSEIAVKDPKTFEKIVKS
jgi:large subunit ribosomal protein L20